MQEEVKKQLHDMEARHQKTIQTVMQQMQGQQKMRE